MKENIAMHPPCPDAERAERRRRAQAGFTLTEMMVVIVIIGLVSTMVGFAAFTFLAQGRADVAKINVERLATSVEMFRAQTGRYPTTDEGLEILTSAGDGGDGLEYEVIDRLPLDPWNRPYQYLYPGEHGDFDVFSYGADGRVGGEGDDADIGNWES